MKKEKFDNLPDGIYIIKWKKRWKHYSLGLIGSDNGEKFLSTCDAMCFSYSDMKSAKPVFLESNFDHSSNKLLIEIL